MTLVQEDGSSLSAHVLDVDKEWVLLRKKAGRKKPQQELLLRLGSIQAIRGV